MMLKRKWLTYGSIALAALAFGAWALAASSKQAERNRKIEEEVSALESEAEKIRRENETLREKIVYFSSQDFREQEAKRKLGLKREDETMVVIRPGAVYDRDRSAGITEGRASLVPDRLLPFRKWWRAFFSG